MTSFAFIMGVVPLVLASGAGAEMRHVMGVAVFSGMLGVTFFGLRVHAALLRPHSRPRRASRGSNAAGDRIFLFSPSGGRFAVAEGDLHA